ncbi:peptidase M28 [Geotalea uraniireducens]|uniref:Peptidase M28 n=1 Tax=Geotalea uraniireducens TaxID=351604 RepID=A0ABM8EL36_9BACT|nr:DUF4910 domain-containing protein [Geotalea uraniireducens]BDV43035.1 peptidase M28 [Geotalea uraniireducens]
MSERARHHTFPEETIGEQAYRLVAELYPLCRSITGDGVRQSLDILARRIPLAVREVPSGTPVFDWTVPQEWNIRDAYVRNSRGEKVIDFRQSNLHVLNYSTPVRATMPLAELKKHLFTLPGQPDLIPYKTSYYRRNWGFCLSHRQLQSLEDGDYEVVIDATLADGYLTYGEVYLPGETEDEILLSCHICHPSLCNDNLSGVSVLTLLAEQLAAAPRRHSYRFLFIPGTIGAITWLAQHAAAVSRIHHGLVVSGIGDRGGLTYKKSRQGNATVDRAVAYLLGRSGLRHEIVDFTPYGYDERQYCSPGFNLPVGRLSRTPFGSYPEYHTSADNLDFVTPVALGEAWATLRDILQLLDGDGKFINLNPYCEPQLGKRGLYDSIGDNELAMLWVLNLSDGEHSLLDIAERSGVEFGALREAAELLCRHALLKRLDG